MTKPATVSIIVYSACVRTFRQAEAVAEGARRVAGVASDIYRLDDTGALPEGAWEKLGQSDAIVFGSPTHMGGPAWQFKKFADDSARPWFTQDWKDKIAAGFTCSSTINGDKHGVIESFFTLAMQHGMIWVGPGLLPANRVEHTRDDINWLGGFAGALAHAPAGTPKDEGPAAGDLATAALLGQRVGEIALKIKG